MQLSARGCFWLPAVQVQRQIPVSYTHLDVYKRQAKRRELEQQLYEVFRKYADKRESEEAGT